MSGVCSDPARPFCDTDGAVAGTANTCIAVSCTPAAFAACRGDAAVTCDATGANYDLVPCQLGCGSASNGCRECVDNTQCSDTTPICNTATSACRGCQLDDECSSAVCNTVLGSCVSETAVVYASPTGSGGGTCSQASPCTTDVAISSAASSGKFLRLLPGLYTTGLTFQSATGQPVQVVATGAQIVTNGGSGTPAITIKNGASTVIRNLQTLAPLHVMCATPTSAASSLTLRDSKLVTTGDTRGFDLNTCAVSLSNVDFNLAGCEIVAALADSSTFNADRTHFYGTTELHLFASGSHIASRVTNSLLENVFLDISGPVSDPGSNYTFAFDTFWLTSRGLYAAQTQQQRISFENTIIASNGTADVLASTAVGLRSCILSSQSAPVSGTTIADPKFVDETRLDFHLQATSPAVDTAATATAGLEATQDLDGVARPQGARSDIGAYEHR